MVPPTHSSARIARRISVRGVVQGVGFRPFVYRLAARHRVAGWVLNGSGGVEIHAEGTPGDVEALLVELQSTAPPAATIVELLVADAAAEGAAEFQIRASRHDAAPTVRIAADLPLCADCLGELENPADRRYEYPYINCMNCGPRYSILRSLPYDRARTTMAAWQLCPECAREYADPLDRRYHAQPTACERCGPGYELIEDGQRRAGSEPAIRRAAELLRAGKIVAVKGIGGYHLACDAENSAAVHALRERKFRKEKPLALLIRDVEQASQFVRLTDAHRRLLTGSARPIVLAPARREMPLIAPDSDLLGLMLPYTPLHHLLFRYGAPAPLVLTSGNRSSEPIAFRDDAAQRQLAGIADAFLVGARPIARRVDDSVVTLRGGRPLMIRRARGYAPLAVGRWPGGGPILALGGDLKNALALVVDGEVFVSQHLGDLDDYETELACGETVSELLEMYEIKPAQLVVAHDLHPQYRSTRLAQSLPAARHVAVQHHEAHLASVLAEHELLDEPVVGVAFDGTGYGADGSIWGGEFFVGSVRQGFERRAWLRPVQMPGGDAAARFPVQAAAGFLAELPDLPKLTDPPFGFPRRFDDALSLVARNVRSFRCSSVGRLFDAVAALCGFTRPITFEGQAAIWLEHQARRCGPQPPYPLEDLDPRPMLAAIVRDRLAGRDPGAVAAAFHAALACATVARIRSLCSQHDLRTVALGGGVFQNEVLWDAIDQQLATDASLRVVSAGAVPLGDGGLALGQAAVAAVREA